MVDLNRIIVPTQPLGDSSNRIANTAFINSFAVPKANTYRRIARHVFPGNTTSVTLDFFALGFSNVKRVAFSLALSGNVSGSPLFYVRINNIATNNKYYGRFVYATADLIGSGIQNNAYSYHLHAIGDASPGSSFFDYNCEGSISMNDDSAVIRTNVFRHVPNSINDILMRNCLVVDTGPILTSFFLQHYSKDLAVSANFPAGTVLDMHLIETA